MVWQRRDRGLEIAGAVSALVLEDNEEAATAAPVLEYNGEAAAAAPVFEDDEEAATAVADGGD